MTAPRKLLFGYNFGKLSTAVIPADQAKAEKGDWLEINPDTMPTPMRKLYDDYKASASATKLAREAFESAFRRDMGIAGTVKTTASTKALSFADLVKAARS